MLFYYQKSRRRKDPPPAIELPSSEFMFLSSLLYPFHTYQFRMFLSESKSLTFQWLLLAVRVEPRLLRTCCGSFLCELITAEPLACLQPRHCKGSFRPLCFWSPCVLGLGPPPVCYPHPPRFVLVSLLRSLPACRCFCHFPLHENTWRALLVFMYSCWHAFHLSLLNCASLSAGLLGNLCWDVVCGSTLLFVGSVDVFLHASELWLKVFCQSFFFRFSSNISPRSH